MVSTRPDPLVSETLASILLFLEAHAKFLVSSPCVAFPWEFRWVVAAKITCRLFTGLRFVCLGRMSVAQSTPVGMCWLNLGPTCFDSESELQEMICCRFHT